MPPGNAFAIAGGVNDGPKRDRGRTGRETILVLRVTGIGGARPADSLVKDLTNLVASDRHRGQARDQAGKAFGVSAGFGAWQAACWEDSPSCESFPKDLGKLSPFPLPNTSPKIWVSVSSLGLYRPDRRISPMCLGSAWPSCETFPKDLGKVFLR